MLIPALARIECTCAAVIAPLGVVGDATCSPLRLDAFVWKTESVASRGRSGGRAGGSSDAGSAGWLVLRCVGGCDMMEEEDTGTGGTVLTGCPS